VATGFWHGARWASTVTKNRRSREMGLEYDTVKGNARGTADLKIGRATRFPGFFLDFFLDKPLLVGVIAGHLSNEYAPTRL